METRNRGARNDEARTSRCALGVALVMTLALCVVDDTARAFERNTSVAGGDVIVVTSVSLLDDPVRGRDHPIAIPGARIEARVVVAHRASASLPVRGVVIREDLRAHLGIRFFSFLPNAYGTVPGHGIEVRAPNQNGGYPTPQSNEADDDAGTYASGIVQVAGIDLQPGESASFRFQVRLQ